MAFRAFPTTLLVALSTAFAAYVEAAPQNITVYPTSGVQGTPVSGYIGSFTASENNSTAASFFALVDWGDGDENPALIEQSPFPGLFTVTSTHTYMSPGTYDLFISVLDYTDNTTNNSGIDITIQPAPIIVTGRYFPSTPNVEFDQVIATFIDENPSDASLLDITVQIDWGDGSLVVPATAVTRVGSSNSYQIVGSHIYSLAGLKVVTFEVTDGNNQSMATGTSFTGDRVFADGFDPSSASSG
jgi:hypothetical protein